MTNAASNALCHSVGFGFVGEQTVTFAGRELRTPTIGESIPAPTSPDKELGGPGGGGEADTSRRTSPDAATRSRRVGRYTFTRVAAE